MAGSSPKCCTREISGNHVRAPVSHNSRFLSPSRRRLQRKDAHFGTIKDFAFPRMGKNIGANRAKCLRIRPINRWKIIKQSKRSKNGAAISIFHCRYRLHVTFAGCSHRFRRGPGEGTRTGIRLAMRLKMAKSSRNGPRRWLSIEKFGSFRERALANVLSG